MKKIALQIWNRRPAGCWANHRESAKWGATKRLGLRENEFPQAEFGLK